MAARAPGRRWQPPCARCRRLFRGRRARGGRRHRRRGGRRRAVRRRHGRSPPLTMGQRNGRHGRAPVARRRNPRDGGHVLLVPCCALCPGQPRRWPGPPLSTDKLSAARRLTRIKARCAGLLPAMGDFEFKVNLVAVVRVRAADPTAARAIVPAVLGAPGSAEIALANQNHLTLGRDATVTSVEFSMVGPIKPLKP